MRLLQIVLGAILHHSANAARFYKECLELSPNPVGNPNVNDRAITNDIELITSKFNSKMRLYQTTTCFDKNLEVTGV